MGTEVVHNPVKEFVSLKEVKVGQEVCIAELKRWLPYSLCRIKTAMFWCGPASSNESAAQRPQAAGKAGQEDEASDQSPAALLPPDRRCCRPNGRVERVQRTAKMECNLLGLTVDEGAAGGGFLHRPCDFERPDCGISHHGNGNGALRTAIHKHLRGNRMVRSFRVGRYGEGAKRRDRCRAEVSRWQDVQIRDTHAGENSAARPLRRSSAFWCASSASVQHFSFGKQRCSASGEMRAGKNLSGLWWATRLTGSALMPATAEVTRAQGSRQEKDDGQDLRGSACAAGGRS